jgi:hypothetical protein
MLLKRTNFKKFTFAKNWQVQENVAAIVVEHDSSTILNLQPLRIYEKFRRNVFVQSVTCERFRLRVYPGYQQAFRIVQCYQDCIGSSSAILNHVGHVSSLLGM